LPGDIFLEIAEGIKNTSIGLLFDTANPLVHGDDPLSLLEPIIDRVVWVHAADTGVRGALKPVVIGTGIVPFHQIFARLHQASFAGGISLEEASGQGPSAMEKALVFTRNAWQQADA
jgi:sugar phosphate isomerase/epimerase